VRIWTVRPVDFRSARAALIHSFRAQTCAQTGERRAISLKQLKKFATLPAMKRTFTRLRLTVRRPSVRLVASGNPACFSHGK
jgi:hypothetical protein